MAGATTTTGNKVTRRKTPARSRVKFGWRKTRAKNIAYEIERVRRLQAAGLVETSTEGE